MNEDDDWLEILAGRPVAKPSSANAALAAALRKAIFRESMEPEPPTDIDSAWAKLSARLEQVSLPAMPVSWRFSSIEPDCLPIVVDVAREIIAKLAPHELAFFPYVTQEFLKHPLVVFRSGSVGAQALAFGSPGGPSAVTTPVLAAVSEAVAFLKDQANMQGRPPSDVLASLLVAKPSPPLTEDNQVLTGLQRQQALDVAVDAARRAGLSSSQEIEFESLVRQKLGSHPRST